MKEVFIVRPGKPEDLAAVNELIMELAIYERAPHEMVNTVEMMMRDGFGPNPVFGFFIAEQAGKIIGASVYYTRYSTWKGPVLYLEDLIVTESKRGIGAGFELFKATAAKALDLGFPHMTWQVLDWNEPAINFYKRMGANLDPEWINGKLLESEMKKLVHG